MSTLSQQHAPVAERVVVDGDLKDILRRSFRPRTSEAAEAVQSAVETLLTYARRSRVVVREDVAQTIEQLVAELDKKISDQLTEVLHNTRFQTLEGAWRGLHYLVSNSDTSENLKIRYLNISKADLGKTLRRFKGVVWDQSPIFKMIYEQEYGQFGGEPFACLIGDYQFDHSVQDVSILTEISKISAAAHAPFISAAAPGLLQMDSWSELSNPRDVSKIFTSTEYAYWRRLRESNDSRYLALTLPRFLARVPYGPKTQPVEEFGFEEKVDPNRAEDFCWANSAYAMGANVTRAFKTYGWCTKIRGIESGGAVEVLPKFMLPSQDSEIELHCPTEIAISDRREHELSESGLMPLVYRKNSDTAAFIGAKTVHRPAIYEDDNATANANLSSRLPYIFATCRFAHYLKCIVRDKIGSFKSREDTQRWLNDWLMNYVDGDPSISSETTKAQRPLSAAEVVVDEIPENPGYYRAQFFLRPHFQLEGLTVSLRLVSKLPSTRKESGA
ncbi:TPA: type VI secretion system contractile sheath large subunit [Burkholderia territorii]|uniref:type VI secretion system contractile sheath large subunit n=1 Tax=Burkholderia cepacia complex TaxID=87882 RepID=UPI000759551B|nr:MULTISPECIES: type VI secretion system contractile sheath large subunit [Burkholderia cepacia complex]KWB12318.1 EvpB family type VI secretion protein [Burkholderia cepacia]TXG05974.1 type VI secretion system contractile sheath large subunit [Burkholderia territorii]HDR8861569.1 type VI secretion system contractile sheath large subunit [Burkholderia territorii]HDR8867672.1 type VI secretion system contractile sheath large subunit [Burkholderia territorii]HDR8873954.1 type VI secretion syste